MVSDKPREIDASPGGFRPSFTGPLYNPWMLTVCVVGFLAMTVVVLAAAWWSGNFWLSLGAIFPAMLAGIALAALFPREYLN